MMNLELYENFKEFYERCETELLKDEIVVLVKSDEDFFSEDDYFWFDEFNMYINIDEIDKFYHDTKN